MKKAVKKTAARSNYDPMKSPIIKLGVVFFYVAVIVLVAYAAKYFM